MNMYIPPQNNNREKGFPKLSQSAGKFQRSNNSCKNVIMFEKEQYNFCVIILLKNTRVRILMYAPKMRMQEEW